MGTPSLTHTVVVGVVSTLGCWTAVPYAPHVGDAVTPIRPRDNRDWCAPWAHNSTTSTNAAPHRGLRARRRRPRGSTSEADTGRWVPNHNHTAVYDTTNTTLERTCALVRMRARTQINEQTLVRTPTQPHTHPPNPTHTFTDTGPGKEDVEALVTIVVATFGLPRQAENMRCGVSVDKMRF